MDNLLELADRIETGEATNANIIRVLQLIPPHPCDERSFKEHMERHDYGTAWIAHRSFWHESNAPNYLTSLDAARALHDAVLPPDRYITIDQNSSGYSVYITEYTEEAPVCIGDGRVERDNPAAAWVAAILRAKAEEKANE